MTTTRKPAPPPMNLIRMSDVEPQEVAWLWPHRLPLGMVAVLDADGGVGKTTATIDIIARLTTERPLPDEAEARWAPMSVVLVGHEDSPAHTIRPRLDAAGADPSRVHLLHEVGGKLPELPRDVALIERVVRDTGSYLLVIDPISAYIGKVDLNRDNEVRAALAPLAGLAERTGACVLMLRHVSKAGGKRAQHRGLGSVAVSNLARVGMMLLEDPDDPSARVLAWHKSNISAIPPSLRWRWLDRDGAPRIEWLGPVDVTADEILRRQDQEAPRDQRDSAVEAAKDWLQAQLADGPRLARDIYAAAEAAGISTTGALRRARTALTVRLTRDARKASWWSLPPQPEQDPLTQKSAQVAQVAQVRFIPEQHEQDEQESRQGKLLTLVPPEQGEQPEQELLTLPCPACGEEWTEADLAAGKCATCGGPVWRLANIRPVRGAVRP